MSIEDEALAEARRRIPGAENAAERIGFVQGYLAASRGEREYGLREYRDGVMSNPGFPVSGGVANARWLAEERHANGLTYVVVWRRKVDPWEELPDGE